MDTARLENLLAAMTRVGASALHLAANRPPSLRVQRRFVGGDETPVPPHEIAELTRDMLFADHRAQLQERGHVEVLYVARSGRRYRANITEIDGAQSLVLRPLPDAPPQLATLGLPDQLAALAGTRRGLVLVSGFFGSGKSTTLAALLGELNQDPDRHIVAIEESIEFLHPPAAALLHQREVGAHVASAADGIRQALAAGADTLVVGEVGSLATLDAVLTAAECGCAVFAGVEAGSVTGALHTLLELAAPAMAGRLRARLARALRAATAQNLLPQSHRHGRVAVVEILLANRAAREAIARGDLAELPRIMQRCQGLGMQTADAALRDLLARHLVAADEALLHAQDRERLLPRGTSPVPGR